MGIPSALLMWAGGRLLGAEQGKCLLSRFNRIANISCKLHQCLLRSDRGKF